MTALGSGTYVVKVVITAPTGDVTTGTQTLTVDLPAVAPFAVSQPSTADLASTGFNVHRPVVLGGLLVLGGFGLIGLTRRRRRDR